MRERYAPEKFERKTKVVFIFESPPSNGIYFYDDKTIGPRWFNWLIEKTVGKKFNSKKESLEAFAKKGYFIIDSTYNEINGLPQRIKESRIKLDSNKLFSKLNGISKVSSSFKIIIVGTPGFKVLSKKLIINKFNVVNTSPIGSPGSNNFFSGLKSYLELI